MLKFLRLVEDDEEDLLYFASSYWIDNGRDWVFGIRPVNIVTVKDASIGMSSGTVEDLLQRATAFWVVAREFSRLRQKALARAKETF